MKMRDGCWLNQTPMKVHVIKVHQPNGVQQLKITLPISRTIQNEETYIT